MDINQILHKYWGYHSYRPLQEDIINAVLDGKDTLALLPTGGGKSICFQVPAMMNDGICIVISPLIALMKDQVENLLQRNIKAVAIYSGMTPREIDITLDNCVYGDTKFLYVSPERIETDIFKERVKKMKVNLIAIDEAHCISQWGYDFRPSYLNIAQLRLLQPNVPFMALTASATPEVVKDIQHQLQFKKENTFQKSFFRENLAYIVINEENKLNRLLKLVNKIKGSSLVYVRNRKKTKEVAKFLIKNSISADYYHAGLTHEERTKKQLNWMKETTRIMVSTNAFGMGIDKPGVRSVIHLDLPTSLEAYFQEAGRAGRDEKKAYAILLFEPIDELNLKQQIENNFPSIETIKKVYHALGNYYQIPIGSALNENYSFDILTFSHQYDLTVFTVFNCLKFLEKEGYIVLSTSNYNPSSIKIEVGKNELYDFQVKNTQFDVLLKTILRSYVGLFDSYVKIDEWEIAKRLNTPKEKLIQALTYLNQLKIISYIKQTNLPQLTYLKERLATENVKISPQNYKDRKKVALKKIESVVDYVTSKHKCRSGILLHYFGEKNSTRCGICDICQALDNNKIKPSDFDAIADQIRTILMKKPLPITWLINKIQGYEDDQIIEVIQWLTDNGKIVNHDQHLLMWKD